MSSGIDSEERLMSSDIRIVVACDVQGFEELDRLLEATAELDEVLGFKLGAISGLGMSLASAVKAVRARTSKLIVYDHQKAGNDIPEIMSRLVSLTAECGVDGFIAFPFAGPDVLVSIVETCRESGILPIVGGHMTHSSFLADQGGFIPRMSALQIYEFAVNLGVRDFVLPANQPEVARSYALRIREKVKTAKFWCPGIGRQGGSATQIAQALGGGTIMAIVGSSLYLAEDPRKVARELVSV